MTCPSCDSPYGLYVSHRKKNDLKYYKLSCKDCNFITNEWIDETNPNRCMFMFHKFGINPYNEWGEEEFPALFKSKNFTKENEMDKFLESYKIIFEDE